VPWKTSLGDQVRIDSQQIQQAAGSAEFLSSENSMSESFCERNALLPADRLKQKASQEPEAALAVVAHELRNPLACVTHAAQLLRLSDSSTHEWALSAIERHVRRMARIVDDALGATRFDEDQATVGSRVVDAAMVIRDAQESVRAQFEAHHQTLTAELPQGTLWLSGDACQLEQVLVNLLTNAMRYTEDGGHIAIHATREGAEVVIRVVDTGIGIEPTKLGSIFGMFFRGEEARTRAEDGMGIGLTVVRSLVERHGGSVSGWSEGLGRGSTFAVRLPAAAPVEPRNFDSEPSASFRAVRVLLVDDHCDLGQGLARLLRLRGHQVHCAETGAAGLSLARSFRPEFALVDACLPDLSGYEVAALLQGAVAPPAPQVATVSGYRDDEGIRLSKAAGAICHLEKPVDVTRLEALFAEPPGGRSMVRSRGVRDYK
jgi:signal transduction histidine kinase/CheY-like chemotaxis protein